MTILSPNPGEVNVTKLKYDILNLLKECKILYGILQTFMRNLYIATQYEKLTLVHPLPFQR